jgi:hypothetical protein
MILFLESPARDIEVAGQPYPVPKGTGAPADRGFFPVSLLGGLGHLDPGLPGVEVRLADSSTSAGRGTVPHRQVDLYFLLFLRS